VLWPALLQDFQENALKPVYRHGDELPSIGHLPAPDWELYRPKNYHAITWLKPRAAARWTAILRRDSAFGGRYRNRSPEEVVTTARSAALHGTAHA